MRSVHWFAPLSLITLTLAGRSTAAEVPAGTVDASCRFNGFQMFGKVKVVESFPDVTVQVVESFPDLKVRTVDAFPDSCGKWKMVENFPDVKIKFVNSFPDVKVKFVESFPGLP